MTLIEIGVHLICGISGHINKLRIYLVGTQVTPTKRADCVMQDPLTPGLLFSILLLSPD